MTQTTATIATWLTRMLNADEAAARAACEPEMRAWKTHEWQPPAEKTDMITRWHVVSEAAEYGIHDAQFVEAFVEFPYGGERRVVEHIARHDPARVLAQVAALRKVLEHCDVLQDRLNDHDAWDVHGVNDILRALASIWADDPGFQDAWR